MGIMQALVSTWVPVFILNRAKLRDANNYSGSSSYVQSYNGTRNNEYRCTLSTTKGTNRTFPNTTSKLRPLLLKRWYEETQHELLLKRPDSLWAPKTHKSRNPKISYQHRRNSTTVSWAHLPWASPTWNHTILSAFQALWFNVVTNKALSLAPGIKISRQVR